MSFKACVVIPVYNHKHAIQGLVNKIQDYGLPCIIVDDGSDLRCREVLNKLECHESQVWLVRSETNQGKGAAVMKGLRLAFEKKFSHVLQIDADGQHTAEDIPKFLEYSRKQPNCLVVGRPIFDRSIPKGRLFARYITHFWVWIETLSFRIKDSMCGFRVYPLNKTFSLINRVSMGKRMDFDIEILVRMYWENVAIYCLPTRVQYPQNNQSHFSPFLDNLMISWMHIRLFFGMLIRLPLLLSNQINRSKGNSIHWAEKKERGVYVGMRALVFAYRYFGETMFKLLLYPVIGYFFLTDSSARRASTGFLQRVYKNQADPENSFVKPTWRNSFKQFINFGESILDKFAWWMSDLDKNAVNFPNQGDLMACVQSKTGGFILVSHLGNIEICRALADGIDGLKMNVLVHTKHAPKFNKLLKEINPRTDLEMIQVKQIGPDLAIQLKQKIDDGEFLSMVADRTPLNSSDRVVYTDFLGDKAAFPSGPFILAGLLECPVFVMFCLKQNDRYTIILERFSESLSVQRKYRDQHVREAVKRFANRLEHYTLLEPLQWYNFFDFWRAV